MIGAEQLQEKFTQFGKRCFAEVENGAKSGEPAGAIIRELDIDEDAAVQLAAMLNLIGAGSPGAHFLCGLCIGVAIERGVDL